MRTRPTHRALAHLPHLHVPGDDVVRAVVSPAPQRLAGEAALHAGLALRQPQAQVHGALDEAEDDDGADGDAADVGGGDAAALGLYVEEGVGVEALGVVGDVGEGEVEGEDDDEPPGVDPGGGGGAGHDDLEEREGAVEGVLARVAEGVELDGEPGARVDEPPVDGGDDEGVGGHGGGVEGVEGLQRAGEAVEQGGAGARVGEGVQGGRQVVEGEAPVGQHGEVAELVGGGGAPAARGRAAVVADLDEVDDDAVETLRGAARGCVSTWLVFVWRMLPSSFLSRESRRQKEGLVPPAWAARGPSRTGL